MKTYKIKVLVPGHQPIEEKLIGSLIIREGYYLLTDNFHLEHYFPVTFTTITEI